MSKNIYKFYKEFKNVSIGTNVCSFKCYQHKTKLNIWIVKDITTNLSIKCRILADEINSFLLKNLPEELNRLVMVKNRFSQFDNFYLFDNFSFVNYKDSNFPVEVSYQDIIFSNNDYLSVFTIQDVWCAGKKNCNIIILDKFKKDGLPYLKILDENSINEFVWIKKEHEFFDLFFIYYENDEQNEFDDVYFKLDGKFED